MKKVLFQPSKPEPIKQKKEAPIKLDQAIEKMSNLLGDSLLPRVQPMNELQSYSLEDYVLLLNERYNKIVELLSQEEESLFSAQEENTKLKAKLAEEVKNHQETVQLAKTEINNLVEKNRTMLSKKHSQNMEKQYKEIELKCNDEKIEIIEGEIKKNMEVEVQLRAEILENERTVKFLESELDSVDSVAKTEESRMIELEKKLDEMQKEYDTFKRQFNLLKSKNSEIEQRLNSNNNQKTAFSENTDKIIQEQKSTLKKTHSHYQKLTELEKLKAKLFDELEVKSEQLALIRTKNQELETKIKGLEFIEKEVKVQEEINWQLAMENELLNKQLEEVSSILGKNSSSKSVLNQSNRKILEAKNMKNYENLLKDNASFSRDQNIEPQRILQQNLEYRTVVETLEREINDKIGIIERQRQKMKEIQECCSNNNAQIGQDIEEKNAMENKYDELAQKMGVLSSNYQILEKKKDVTLKVEEKKKPNEKKTNTSLILNNSTLDKKENGSEVVVFSSPKKKEKIETKPNQKSEKSTKDKDYMDLDILSKNPIKLELKEISKTLKSLEGIVNNRGKDLKTLDNI